ncbi:YceI family protein [Chitinophaga barathri]|uniref:Polyisoprenoid-binding protein n=1 Tax=Chitinophaga barathri TaxID=1647451 RepID=A0A3N4MAL7_9BACT|nr:YceI family protein [Chitinophaga barathri]RPD40812.1 polyisoprenoid-binding protein [Chitinophaga barathri]
MKKLLFALLLYSPLLAGAQAATWKVDRDHSSVAFSVTHLVISEVEGNFKNFEGELKAAKPDFSDATITFSVDVFSISTGNDPRDNHLKSNDFLNAEKYPKMTFKSTSFTRITEGKYLLEGDLTIRDVTKSVKFNVTYGGTAKDPANKLRAGFKANTYINRFDYNLKWDKMTEAGGMVVDKMVNIELKLELIKQ